MFMTNGEFLFVRADVCRRCLEDFFDFLVENSCPDSTVFALVSSSLLSLQNLEKYVKSLEVSASK